MANRKRKFQSVDSESEHESIEGPSGSDESQQLVNCSEEEKEEDVVVEKVPTHKKPKTESCNNDDDSEEKREKWRNNYAKNRTHIRKTNSEWRAKDGNQERINERERENHAYKMENDPEFRRKQREKSRKQEATQKRKDQKSEYNKRPGTLLRGKWFNLKQKAKERAVDVLITQEVANKFFTQPCYYCDDPPGHSWNGIDRVDASKPYMEGNIVACCKWCNWTKLDYDVRDFAKISTNVAAKYLGDDTFPLDYNFVKPMKKSGKHTSYKCDAKRSGKEFDLDKKLFNQLVKKPCTYCGIHIPGHNLGLDRVDSSIGYLPNNVVTCCPRCNFAKNHQTVDEFMERCLRIAHNFQSGDAERLIN